MTNLKSGWRMKALRVKLYQPFANYRPHYSMQVRHSYPLPPPSSIIGLIHKILGMSPASTYRDDGETIRGFDLAVLGKYGGIAWDYQWLLSPQKKGDKKILFTSSYSPLKGIKFKQIPVKVQILTDVELVIYLSLDFEKYKEETKEKVKKKLGWKDEEDALEKIKEKFLNPEETPYLGRAEDMVIIDPDNMKPEIVDLEEKEAFELKNYSTWIPAEIAKEHDIFGPVYNLPGYYTKKEIPVMIQKEIQKWHIRDFDFSPCVYAEPQEIGFNKNMKRAKAFFEKDNNKRIEEPIWFILNKKE